MPDRWKLYNNKGYICGADSREEALRVGIYLATNQRDVEAALDEIYIQDEETGDAFNLNEEEI